MHTEGSMPAAERSRHTHPHGEGSGHSQVHGHLESGCPECAAELTFWTRSLLALRAQHTPAASDATLDRAFSLFERTATVPASRQGTEVGERRGLRRGPL